MIFAIEPISQCWDEWKSLAASHWEGPFNPDYERYKRSCETGWFIMATGRDNGKLAAYCGLYVMPSMHTMELMAMEDFVYIAPEQRRGRNAALFYRFCEDEVKRRGATEVFLKVKPDSVAERYIKAMDYRLVKAQYAKKLT